MAPPTPTSKKTGKFDEQGHTAGPYGNDPDIKAIPVVEQEPRELNL